MGAIYKGTHKGTAARRAVCTICIGYEADAVELQLHTPGEKVSEK